jgi:hypothetical protein
MTGVGVSARPRDTCRVRKVPRPSEVPPGPETLGPTPHGDGWGAVYRLYDSCIRPFPMPRELVRRYFWPSRIERAREGLLFHALGVPRFGRLVPTGGVAVRRATGARMRPYTLAGPSLRAARAFFYRACIFEALHLVPMVLLLALCVRRLLEGRPDLAAEDMLINLVVNVYPILHHRHTRLRILRLLRLDARRRGERGPLRPRRCGTSVAAAIP